MILCSCCLVQSTTSNGRVLPRPVQSSATPLHCLVLSIMTGFSSDLFRAVLHHSTVYNAVKYYRVLPRHLNAFNVIYCTIINFSYNAEFCIVGCGVHTYVLSYLLCWETAAQQREASSAAAASLWLADSGMPATRVLLVGKVQVHSSASGLMTRTQCIKCPTCKCIHCPPAPALHELVYIHVCI